MASGFTNKGKFMLGNIAFRNGTEPTNFFVALVTNAAIPTADTNTLGQLTEIASGNGYTAGGFSLNRNATDFDGMTENDTDDRLEALIKDVAWTAAGGSIPASGGGARYAVLTDDNVTVGSREVYAFWDLSSDRTATVGQVLTLQNLELRIA